MIPSWLLEQKAKTPEGASARWRPRRRSRGGSRQPLGKRSHLRKSTAVFIKKLKSRHFQWPLEEWRVYCDI
ncbi:hypothetical protein AAV98_11720 [Bacillus sp. CHD6a]|nr:hypothetical protein AAV98_11720 [Bacillus sp. CHD6a]